MSYKLLKKIDPYIIILLVLGFVVFLTKCLIVYPIRYVGHADASGYAEMADSLIHGRGFEVDYISFYFIKYPHIYRPEDHWPPLYSIFIAPFFLILGKSAFSAKLPSIIISSFFLPITLYYLTRELSKSRVAGLSAGITILLSPFFYENSLHCLSDVTYAFVVSAFVLFGVMSLDKKKYSYPTGFFMGLAYYAKGSGILLIPCYILFYILAHIKFKRWRLQILPIWNAIKSRSFLMSLLVAFLVLLPWMVRNTVHFRNPFFSTQNFVSGYGGYVDWEVGTYELYWGEKPPPSFRDKFKNGIGYVADMTWKYFKTNIWWIFMDIYSQWRKFSKNAFLTYFVCVPTIPGLFLLWRNKKRHLIWITTLVLLAFLSFTWFPINRMILPFIPLMVVLSWCAYFIILKIVFKYLDKGFAFIFDRFSNFVVNFIDQIKSISKHKCLINNRLQLIKMILFDPKISTGFAILCFLAPVIILSSESIVSDKKNRGYPFRETDQAWMDMGDWLKNNAPSDSITMTRNPWELHFYSEQPAIQIPRTSLDKTIEVMRFYNVNYIIPQLNIRPSLEPLVTGEILGLELVYDNKTLQLYKVHHNLLGKQKVKTTEQK